MAAFQSGTIHIKEKSTTQANADSGWLRVYAKADGSVYRKDENGDEYRFIGNVEVASISGNLQSQISAITVPTSATFLSDYDARYVNESDLTVTLGNYTLLSTTESISASLYNDILQASTRTIGFTIDGGTSVPTTGTYASIVSPFSGTITSWTIISDISGSATLDVWKANGAKPTNANSITASAKPTLTSSDYATSSTLTGWTTSVSSGDVFTVELEAISGCNRLTLQLGMTI
jgi:hypothetical protein